MFWIFANDKDYSLAPNNTALGTTFANGGRNFHYSISLLAACLMTAKGLIILTIFRFVYIFQQLSGSSFTRQSGGEVLLR